MKCLFLVFFFIPITVLASQEFDYDNGIIPDSGIISDISSYLERHVVIVTLFISLSIIFGTSYWIKKQCKAHKKKSGQKAKSIFLNFKFNKNKK